MTREEYIEEIIKNLELISEEYLRSVYIFSKTLAE